ncbi:MAG: hypothetical protein QOH67_117 [Hyphomicrobiales bacterium]|jgi:hypothetical protein|nr:hypothetical protein [Hyphomicrobiales bacterium]
MGSDYDPEKARSDFLIAMYNQLMNDINRHIVVIWQSVGVLFGAFAAFALVEKQIITLDVAASLIILLCVWVIAHVYDAGYWYNRNLVIIANIERQFLRQSDLQEIHYYFGSHRRTGTMITHLEIQMALAVAVALLVLLFHLMTVVIPIYCYGTKAGTGLTALPWIVAVVGVFAWAYSRSKARRRYETFLRNSPGKAIDASTIQHGPGHPT